jgi:hypothetical protein
MRVESPATCVVCSVIWFLNVKNVRPAEIHRQIVEGYGEGAMNEGSVSKWYQLFKAGWIVPDGTSPPVHIHITRTVQVKNFWASSIQSWTCTKWLSLVAPPQVEVDHCHLPPLPDMSSVTRTGIVLHLAHWLIFRVKVIEMDERWFM